MNSETPKPSQSLRFADPIYRQGIMKVRKDLIRNTIIDLLEEHNITHGIEVDDANLKAFTEDAAEELWYDWD